VSELREPNLGPHDFVDRPIHPDPDRPDVGVTLEDTDVTSRAGSVWIRFERFENRIETSAYVGGELGKLLLGPTLEPDLEWSQAQSSPNVFRTDFQPRPRRDLIRRRCSRTTFSATSSKGRAFVSSLRTWSYVADPILYPRRRSQVSSRTGTFL